MANKHFAVSRLRTKCVVLGLAAFLLALASLPAQQVPVVEKTLPNGMRLLLVARHDEPTVAGGWVAHVGSSNEKPGSTGIAHLFEHMMFKGTTTIGTKDYKADVRIMDEQEKVRDEMRAEEAKLRAAWRRGELNDTAPTVTTNKVNDDPKGRKEVAHASTPDSSAFMLAPENWTPRYKELRKRFLELVAEQRSVLVKNEFDKIYSGNGASGMNAFTSEDMTCYFCTVPANKLELWLWMESERLFRPVRREFYAERDVVFEERRMRTDSPPLGLHQEAFQAMFWESHPYSWPTVGWPSDIPAISKKQADDFYATYYAPQNLTAVLVGDFDPDQALALAEKYFGRIPGGTNAVPDVVTLEMTQHAEKRMNAEADTNPQVDILWHTVPFAHKNSYALDILAQLLSERTGRLYKGLVMGSGVATEVDASQVSQKWAGYFDITGEAADGHTPAEVEQGIYAELDKLKHDEVPAEELQKVKNQFSIAEFRKLETNMGIMMGILQNDGNGDWHEFENANKKIQAVTAADVKRVANEYFTKENRAVATYTRKSASPEEKQ